MYVTLSVIFILFLWAAVSLGQKVFPDNDKNVTQFDRMKRRMELREEMHRRMMDKLINGIGPDQDLFKDMEEDFQDAFKGFDSFGGMSIGQSVDAVWEESASGRTLVITPKEKGQNLDIRVEKGAITIKGEVEQKTAHGSSKSSFNNMFAVPGDCDEAQVKIDQKADKILVHFPYLKDVSKPKVVEPPKPERRPIPSGQGEVTI